MVFYSFSCCLHELHMLLKSPCIIINSNPYEVYRTDLATRQSVCSSTPCNKKYNISKEI
jgi:hypothetical protein